MRHLRLRLLAGVAVYAAVVLIGAAGVSSLQASPDDADILGGLAVLLLVVAGAPWSLPVLGGVGGVWWAALASLANAVLLALWIGWASARDRHEPAGQHSRGQGRHLGGMQDHPRQQ